MDLALRRKLKIHVELFDNKPRFASEKLKNYEITIFNFLYELNEVHFTPLLAFNTKRDLLLYGFNGFSIYYVLKH